jgi:ribonucleoside-diphosphate reductase alpha chain
MIKYSREEVKKATLDYFKGDELAIDVWINKYCLKDSEGNYYELSPDDMHNRLANEFFRIENIYNNINIEEYKIKNLSLYGQNRKKLSNNDIYELFKDFKYVIPQGSVMSTLGDPNTVASLSNCVVVPQPYDSYGGILFSDQQLAQLFKRRCVEENSNVISLEKGIIPIKDIEIGMSILSYNIDTNISKFKKVLNKFYTEVEKEDRINIKFSNGSYINSSKKHPILVLDEKYNYKNIKDIKENDITIKVEKNNIFNNNFDENLKDIGWFIGNHMGDGTCGLKDKKYIRFRNLGNEENTIKKYTEVLNFLLKSKNEYLISKSKRFKSKVWEVTFNNKDLFKIIEDYFDNQIGKKTYNGFVPSYIKDNNLYFPFIAGLIDSDGTIKGRNTLQLSMCMKTLIEDIALFLNKNGISYHISKKISKRLNEQPIYRLTINSSEIEFINNIKKYMYNLDKIEKLNKFNFKPYSYKKYLTSNERESILNNYKNIKLLNITNLEKQNLRSIIVLLKKDKNIGIGSLNIFNKFGLLTNEKYFEINQRISIEKISQDKISQKYIDIVVEDNNNFYCGNFGFVVIHNCGVGIDISSLRPENSITKNSAKTSTGGISFMERFSNTTREVAMNNRRGALMISIDVNYYDIEKFINIKKDLKKVTGANISIKISDDFMNCVENNLDFELKFPTTSSNPQYSKKVNAKKLWNQIIDAVYISAEPGLIFWDRQHNYSTSSIYPKYINISTNPCSEIAMGNDTCRLIATNMYSLVENPFTKNAKFNFKKWYSVIYEAQRLMDDLVDLELESMSNIINKVKNDPEPDYIKNVELLTWENLYNIGKSGRRTGLGLTGLADTIAALGFKYDSDESLNIVDEIMKTKCKAEFDSSIDMAIERGKFDDFDINYEEKSDFIQMLKIELPDVYDRMMKYGRRNISISTVAPNGSLSCLTQTTSGIEPVYMLSYKRRKKINNEDKNSRVDFVDDMGDKWQEFEIFHNKLNDWLSINKKPITESPYYGSSASEIDWKKRVEIQSIIQKFITHSISSTCNLKSDVSKETISDIYFNAWKHGLKGITIYRDGSRSGVLVSSEKKKEDVKIENLFKEHNAPKRPEILECDIIRFVNKGEKWIGFVGLLDNEPYEIFTGKAEDITIPTYIEKGKIKKIKNGDIDGRSRYDLHIIDKSNHEIIIQALNRTFNAEFWNIAKMISAVLRHGMPLNSVIKLIDSLIMEDHISTWKSGVKRIIKKYLKESENLNDKICPSCGQPTYIFENGCAICKSCGHSEKCG